MLKLRRVFKFKFKYQNKLNTNWATKTSNNVDLPLLPLNAMKNDTLHKFDNLKLS